MFDILVSCKCGGEFELTVDHDGVCRRRPTEQQSIGGSFCRTCSSCRTPDAQWQGILLHCVSLASGEGVRHFGGVWYWKREQELRQHAYVLRRLQGEETGHFLRRYSVWDLLVLQYAIFTSRRYGEPSVRKTPTRRLRSVKYEKYKRLHMMYLVLTVCVGVPASRESTSPTTTNRKWSWHFLHCSLG